MPKKLLAILLIAIALFSLSILAVVPASASGFTLSSRVAPKIGPNQISIDDSSNGATITLSTNDTLTVNLNYVGGAPVFWQLEPFNTSVLQMVDNHTIPSGIPGGTGTEVWVFKALGLGTSPIFMKYLSVSGQVVKTFNLTVNVIAAPVPASSNPTIGILVACLTAFLAWLTFKKPRQSRM